MRRARTAMSGRGFNGAATFQPRNGIRELEQLIQRYASMGPRLFSRGMGVLVRVEAQAVRASMGPRLFSRGMMRATDCSTVSLVASMGPRLFSRGMWTGCGPSAGAPCCFNGAATFQPRNAARTR